MYYLYGEMYRVVEEILDAPSVKFSAFGGMLQGTLTVRVSILNKQLVKKRLGELERVGGIGHTNVTFRTSKHSQVMNVR